MKNKKAAIGFDRHMSDREIIKRLLGYAKPYWKSFILVLVIMGFTVADMAKHTEVSEEEYIALESGSEDFSFTFMHKCLPHRKLFYATHLFLVFKCYFHSAPPSIFAHFPTKLPALRL